MKILGRAEATAEQMAAYLLSKNSNPRINMPVLDFCKLYISEGEKEGVCGDALFAQSCKETGNFKFTGTVTPDQNNFSGLGTTSATVKGAYFPDAATGILAQAQHAKGYATKDALNCPCVDPRYDLLIKYGKAGTAPNWEDLGGKWAVPGYDTNKYASLDAANRASDSYGYHIVRILNDILNTKVTQKQEEEKMATKIIALDAGHWINEAGKRCLKSIDPNETREWYLNDRIMDRVQVLLEDYDCKTLRTDDTTGAKNISNSGRVSIANNANADFFLSMHHDASINGGTGGGTTVYYCSSKAYRKTQAQKLYNEIVSRTGLRGNRNPVVIKKGFTVIKNTTMPALLVENGYMDSQVDTPIILTAEHAEKTAQGVVAFLVDELKLEKKKTAGNGTQNAQSGTSTSTTTTTTTTANTYTVKSGDALSKIGQATGIDWKKIAELNGIKSPYTIYVGQKLKLGDDYYSANTYTVKSGDTLRKIGRTTGIDWKKIADINGIKSPYTIRVGQVLKLANDYYPAYTGKTVTLSAALTSLGISSTYAFRKKIAAANGITGYIGSASQNTQMYNLLKAGLLKKAQ